MIDDVDRVFSANDPHHRELVEAPSCYVRNKKTMMKLTKLLLRSIPLTLLISGGTAPASLSQAQRKTRIIRVQPSPAVREAIQIRSQRTPNGESYDKALIALNEIQRNAHRTHDVKQEAEAIREIKITIQLQAIYRKWQNQARQEIKAGRLGLITYGIASSVDGVGIRFLEKNYPITRKKSYGCMLGGKEIAEIDGYNEIMRSEIERRYGKDFFEKARQREQQSYRQPHNQRSSVPRPPETKSETPPRK